VPGASPLTLIEQRIVGMQHRTKKRNPSMKCYCCKEEVNRVNDEEVCWSCDLVQTLAAILEEKHIAGETAVALAYDLHGYAVSHIIERIGEEHELSQELIRTLELDRAA
jgi:hypothetical protein